jgi:hypothetical protein
MNSRNILCLLLLLSGTSVAWCQAPATDAAAAVPPIQYSDERMSIPAAVNSNGYSLSLSDETSTRNHISGGTAFGLSKDDNILSSSSHPLSAIGYYMSPWISLAESSTRTEWTINYNPRFTGYERMSSLDRTDQDFNADFVYRITPYAMIRFEDGFTKSSDLLNQIGSAAPLADLQLLQYASVSIVPALANVLMNRVSVEAGYQFGENDMVGGEFREVDLRYPNSAQAVGLYDSTTLSGEGFYSHRISSNEYIGALFRDEKLSAFPDGSETGVQGVLFFYSTTIISRLSFSLSAGPEHSTTFRKTYDPTTAPLRTWSPAFGTGLRWQGDRTSISANFTKRIQGGGGLLGAVRARTIDVSTRYQLSRLMSVQIAAAYSDNTVLGWNTSATSTSGHGFLASTSLERQLGQHFSLQIGYGREQQRYVWLPASSGLETRNRSWMSLTYRFDRPLGGA